MEKIMKDTCMYVCMCGWSCAACLTVWHLVRHVQIETVENIVVD